MYSQTDASIDAEIGAFAKRYREDGLKGLSAMIKERVSHKPIVSGIYLLADQTLNPIVGNLDPWPGVPETKNGWLNFRLNQGGSTGFEGRARARVYRLHGGYYLLVGRDVHELDNIRTLISSTLSWGLVLTIGLALFGGASMARSMVGRIETINEASREIMSGDLSRRIPSFNSGDELDELVANLNKMLAQIESLMDDVRRVSDNIAHDLRTPLARLRNRLESLKTDVIEPDQQQQSVERAVQEADSLLITFNALLRIARIESANNEDRFARVDLECLVRDVADLYEPLIEESEKKLRMRLSHAVINGDRDLLFQAIANLVDNAAKYTPSGGDIEISLDGDSDRPSLTIADNGPGIPKSAHNRVFQRFFRLESSRSTLGNGLGLSLVAAIIKRHSAEIELYDNEPGLGVRIIFAKSIQKAAA